MAQKFYLAGFEKQGTGSALGWKNCGAASGAMLVDQSSLGYKNPSPDAFRTATGDFEGGLYISQVGSTMESKYGQPVTVYDGSDGLTWATLFSFLKQGRFAVVNGDYGVLPTPLTGSDTFNGLHAVVFHSVSTDGTKIRVGDPLNDGRRLASGRYAPKGWIWWPTSVAKAYVEAFDRQVPGASLHACVMDLRRLRARPVSPATNVRSGPGRSYPVIGKFGGTTLLVWGAKVTGESIAGNRIWYRVWHPGAAKVGYCHSSVVAVV